MRQKYTLNTESSAFLGVSYSSVLSVHKVL